MSDPICFWITLLFNFNYYCGTWSTCRITYDSPHFFRWQIQRPCYCKGCHISPLFRLSVEALFFELRKSNNISNERQEIENRKWNIGCNLDITMWYLCQEIFLNMNLHQIPIHWDTCKMAKTQICRWNHYRGTITEIS